MSLHTSNPATWAGADRAPRSGVAPRISEDWLSVVIGLLIFVLTLAVLANVEFGQITPDHPSYEGYRNYLKRTIEEPFSLFLRV